MGIEASNEVSRQLANEGDSGVAAASPAQGRFGEPAPEHHDLAYEMARLRELKKRRFVRYSITLFSVVASAFLQAYALQAFVQPADLLSSGFTGVAILVDRITSLFGVGFPTFIGMVVLNIPVAIISWKSISKRFVIFSMLQVVLSSLFLRTMSFEPVLNNILLEVVFGGFLYGFAIALALRGGASTAGTDFISLLVSNKTGKSIWGAVFAGNCAVLIIFGVLFGWTAAAYSIIFQFISTKTIEGFYHRYDRLTLQITTKHPSAVLDVYNEGWHHGSSCFEVMGGHSCERFWIISTVISAYELDEIIYAIRSQDDRAVINILRTEDFRGGFYRAEW